MSGVPGALVERERELQELDRLVQGALEGQAMLALVEGPAGIGKSRLLAAAREKATAAGFRVLGARGSDLERELPFGIVRQLFEPVLVDGTSAGAGSTVRRGRRPGCSSLRTTRTSSATSRSESSTDCSG